MIKLSYSYLFENAATIESLPVPTQAVIGIRPVSATGSYWEGEKSGLFLNLLRFADFVFLLHDGAAFLALEVTRFGFGGGFAFFASHGVSS